MKKIALTIAVLTLTACAAVKDKNPSSPGSDDVLPGGVVKGTDTAVIAIGIMNDGMPKVLVDPIIVTEGQRVVWAGPEDMTIEFPNTSPFRDNRLTSENAVINALVPKLNSEDEEQEFKYNIIVNGVTLDPVMIVRKQF